VPETRILPVSSDHPSANVIDEAAAILNAGGIVAFPTETVYGLAADAFNENAVRRVFAAKGRPGDNPLIVHLAGVEQVSQVAAKVPSLAERLAAAFWPGPLTLVLHGNGMLPAAVTAGLDTVAVRVPDHPVPRDIIIKLGRGIVGPSANLSGRPSPTTAGHVFADLQGQIDLILDAGPTHIGLESTVVDVTVRPPVILRPGGVTREELEKTAGPMRIAEDLALLRRSPGTRHRHYAPRAEVIVVQEGGQNALDQNLSDLRAGGRSIGVIVRTLNVESTSGLRVVRAKGSVESYARLLFGALRELDGAGVDAIVIEAPEERGIGEAIVDRIRRAARGGNPI